MQTQKQTIRKHNKVNERNENIEEKTFISDRKCYNGLVLKEVRYERSDLSQTQYGVDQLHQSVLPVSYTHLIELAGVERLQRIPVQDLTPLDRWRIVLKFAGDPDKAAWIQAIMAIDEGCRRAVEKMMEIPMSMIEYMWETKRLDREMMRNSEIREERERAVKKARDCLLYTSRCV